MMRELSLCPSYWNKTFMSGWKEHEILFEFTYFCVKIWLTAFIIWIWIWCHQLKMPCGITEKIYIYWCFQSIFAMGNHPLCSLNLLLPILWLFFWCYTGLLPSSCKKFLEDVKIWFYATYHQMEIWWHETKWFPGKMGESYLPISCT